MGVPSAARRVVEKDRRAPLEGDRNPVRQTGRGGEADKIEKPQEKKRLGAGGPEVVIQVPKPFPYKEVPPQRAAPIVTQRPTVTPTAPAAAPSHPIKGAQTKQRNEEQRVHL